MLEVEIQFNTIQIIDNQDIKSAGFPQPDHLRVTNSVRICGLFRVPKRLTASMSIGERFFYILYAHRERLKTRELQKYISNNLQ